MELKLIYYEDENIKIEIKDGGLTYVKKNAYLKSILEEIDYAIGICKYINDALTEIHNQPERSKREDSVHKYLYKLVNGYASNSDEMHIGFVYSKDEAIEWCRTKANAAYHELVLCNVTGMRCSEHCGNTVREAL